MESTFAKKIFSFFSEDQSGFKRHSFKGLESWCCYNKTRFVIFETNTPWKFSIVFKKMLFFVNTKQFL